MFRQHKCYTQNKDTQTLVVLKHWLSQMYNVVSMYGINYGPFAALAQAQMLTTNLISIIPINGPRTMLAIIKLRQTLAMDPCSQGVMMMFPCEAAQLSHMYLDAFATVINMRW
jgi:hypothetical protein